MAERRVATASLAVCLLLLAHVALDQSRRSGALFQSGLSVPSQAQRHSALAASRLDVGYVALLSAGGMARTQMLAGKWSRGALAGKATLVTMCAKGDNSACDKLAADPNAIGALEDIDKSNPDGFAAHHPKAFHSLRQEETVAWKGGALKDMNNARWLRACGEGNYYACKHIGDSNDAIQTLIKGHQSRVIVKPKKEKPLAPVYVARAKKGFMASLMDSLGLGDTYFANSPEGGRVQKMRPDQGLVEGSKAVYNDGTVGMFSDSQ